MRGRWRGLVEVSLVCTWARKAQGTQRTVFTVTEVVAGKEQPGYGGGNNEVWQVLRKVRWLGAWPRPASESRATIERF